MQQLGRLWPLNVSIHTPLRRVAGRKGKSLKKERAVTLTDARSMGLGLSGFTGSNETPVALNRQTS